jgi:hypothetical protein
VIVLGVLIILTWRRSDQASRRDAGSVMVWFAVMAVFAVGVDTLHSFFDMGTTADFLLTTIEDGGEMLALIPAVAAAFALAARE